MYKPGNYNKEEIQKKTERGENAKGAPRKVDTIESDTGGENKARVVNHKRAISNTGKVSQVERNYDLPLSKDFTSTVINKNKPANRVHYAEEQEEEKSSSALHGYNFFLN